MVEHGVIERVVTPARGYFQTHFAQREQPVIITGALEHWPARTQWTATMLRQSVGAERTRFKQSPSHRHPDFLHDDPATIFKVQAGTFAEFLDKIVGDQASRFLLTGEEEWLIRRRDGKAEERTTKLWRLLDDFEVPPFFDRERLYSSWFWLSGSGVRTWLHYDTNGCHNLNAQVQGQKTVWLFAPEELPNTYPFPLGHRLPAYNCCQVDAESPDTARFPRFAQAHALVGEVNAGDLLFIPAHWIHCFQHTGAFNANVNFWWKPERLRHTSIAVRQTLLDAIADAGGWSQLHPEAQAQLKRIDERLTSA